MSWYQNVSGRLKSENSLCYLISYGHNTYYTYAHRQLILLLTTAVRLSSQNAGVEFVVSENCKLLNIIRPIKIKLNVHGQSSILGELSLNDNGQLTEKRKNYVMLFISRLIH